MQQTSTGSGMQAAPGRRNRIDDLPTLKIRKDGSRDFWSVPKPQLDLRSDLELGFDLAGQTLDILRAGQINNGVLSRILAQAPQDCSIAKGFRLAIEQEVLAD